MQKLTYQDLQVIDQDKSLSAGCVRFVHNLNRAVAGRLDWFKLSHGYMAKVAGVSVATIKRYIVALIAAGYFAKRLNAATLGGIKYRAASSYRFIKPDARLEVRKMKSIMQGLLMAKKAARRSALWLTSKLTHVEENILRVETVADNPIKSDQTAREAMEYERWRRGLPGGEDKLIEYTLGLSEKSAAAILAYRDRQAKRGR